MDFYHYNAVIGATHGLDGWCSPAKQITLVNLVLAIKPRCIVEIGVWGGMSLIPMAIASTVLEDKPAIYAVDPWLAAESVKGQDTKDAHWWGVDVGQPKHEEVYNRFIAKLMAHGLRGDVNVMRMTSDAFNPPDQIQLIHVDGNHGPQALRDVQKFGPNIPVGGICVLDDLDWSGGNVGKAAEWLKTHGFLELHPLGTGAVFMRMK